MLTGYARKDGRYGFRNHVLLFPLHSALSAIARQVSDEVSDSVSISHDWSGEIDSDYQRIIKTMAGYAANPNIYATIFLGVGSSDAETEIIEQAKSIGLNNFEVFFLAEIKSISELKKRATDSAKRYSLSATREPRAKVP